MIRYVLASSILLLTTACATTKTANTGSQTPSESTATTSSVSSPTSEQSKESGYLFETQFEVKTGNKTVTSTSKIVVPKGSKHWTTLTEPKKGIALLGRIMTQTDKTIGMEYIVVDTTKKNAVLSTPQIVTNLGQKAEISSFDGKERVKITLTATETEFTKTTNAD